MLYYIEFAIYMYNKAYIKRGVKRIPEEISTMKYLPIGFDKLYWKLIKAESVEGTKEISTMLMKAVKEFAKQMKDKVISKKEISEDAIKGTLERDREKIEEGRGKGRRNKTTDIETIQ